MSVRRPGPRTAEVLSGMPQAGLARVLEDGPRERGGAIGHGDGGLAAALAHPRVIGQSDAAALVRRQAGKRGVLAPRAAAAEPVAVGGMPGRAVAPVASRLDGARRVPPRCDARAGRGNGRSGAACAAKGRCAGDRGPPVSEGFASRGRGLSRGPLGAACGRRASASAIVDSAVSTAGARP
ncbi:hypothetical protein SAHL_10515 [Salinisphaera orenii YIM 95161]|uniref:Uncharacterized protein n=1 Tax=Salinisphaera orenii YIM 95161 TaxID=1051139 RepID=A0A423PRP9_9GAMM|nr:hypothetical protein SAHL_10515 [Salinisphaera halophila YIM 95161]